MRGETLVLIFLAVVFVPIWWKVGSKAVAITDASLDVRQFAKLLGAAIHGTAALFVLFVLAYTARDLGVRVGGSPDVYEGE